MDSILKVKEDQVVIFMGMKRNNIESWATVTLYVKDLPDYDVTDSVITSSERLIGSLIEAEYD